MSDGDTKQPANEPADERALRHSLRANALSPEALQRIRRATEQEWRATIARSSRRAWFPVAAAASAVLVIAAGWLVWGADPVSADAPVLGQVARVESPGMVQVRALRRDVTLKSGAPIRVGQSLDVRGDSLVALQGGGNLRVARATALEVVSASAIKLERGELYVDIPPAAHGKNSFIVVTPAGEFRHVGTQFAVAIVNGQTRLRVREGTVSWHASDGDSNVTAGTEVLIDGGQKVTRKPIATVGRDWAWAEAMAPEIDIENRPLMEFLDWFSRETGRQLVLADDAARKQATAIRMHGNVRGLTAMEALSAVMASTSLRFELPEGVIRVSSAREISAPPT
jgi:ferric-dicitrate binding protein FerR (iron transport regulator)